MSGLVTILVESYGPIGLLTAFLWFQQRKIVAGLLRLAEEDPDVDEEKLAEELKPPILGRGD